MGREKARARQQLEAERDAELKREDEEAIREAKIAEITRQRLLDSNRFLF